MTKRRLTISLTALLAAAWSSDIATAQTISLFANQVPGTPAETADTSSVTLGVRFFSTVPGMISGVRFYRGARNSNGYTARLYTSAGTMLAQATAPGDPRSFTAGWKTATFASPVSIAANTTYVASYYTSNGRYADDQYALTNGVNAAPLMANASVPGAGNGVYTYSTGFPDQTWNDSNYYVDVAFAPSNRTLLMSFNPTNPSVPADTAPGSTVAMVNVSWSDGSPFGGTLGFTAPYADDGGTFALSGNTIIVNPAGPGVGADANTMQNITVQAIQ